MVSPHCVIASGRMDSGGKGRLPKPAQASDLVDHGADYFMALRYGTHWLGERLGLRLKFVALARICVAFPHLAIPTPG